MKYRSCYLAIIVFILTISLNCANLGSPEGGPKDETPPEIISVKPEPGSVNIPLDTKFEIVFSKYMNQTATENAVFISPLFFNYPTFKWSGKKLTIIPPEKLRENTTYVLTVGALAQGYHGNKLGTSKSFSFSTGETIYDGSIYGQVLSANSQKLNVWAYKLESDDPDTFWMRVPDYVTQPDSMGHFRIEYLSSGYYMVVADEDKNDDQFWEPPGEKLALPDTIIYLGGDDEEFGPMVMMTVPRDTLQPSIGGARSPDERSVIVDFSQPMDSSNVLDKSSYGIFPVGDSLQLAEIDLIFPLKSDFKSVFLRCTPLEPGAKYKIIARSLESVYGVAADTSSRLFAAGAIDTVGPALLAIEPPSSKKPLPAGFDIALTFSEPIDTAGFKNKLSFADTLDNPVEFFLDWVYPNKISLAPQFEANNYYIFSYDERMIFDLDGNPLGDSLKEYTYITASPDSFGQILGTVANAPGNEVAVIVEPKQGDNQRTGRAEADGSFYIGELFPGIYRVRAYFDKNNNGRFDGGGIKPFEYAEPIAIYPDTVKVRARWETDIGVLDFKPHTINVDTLR